MIWIGACILKTGPRGRLSFAKVYDAIRISVVISCRNVLLEYTSIVDSLVNMYMLRSLPAVVG